MSDDSVTNDVKAEMDAASAKVAGLVQAGGYIQGGIQALKLAREVYQRIGRDDSELTLAEQDLEDERQALHEEAEAVKVAFQERSEEREQARAEAAQAANAKVMAQVASQPVDQPPADDSDEDPVKRELAKERQRDLPDDAA